MSQLLEEDCRNRNGCEGMHKEVEKLEGHIRLSSPNKLTTAKSGDP